MTYDDLVAILTPLGYRIVLPGETDVALPCIFLNPQGIRIEENFPVAWEVCAISSRVPLAQNNPAQWDEARTMMYQIMNAFRGEQVRFDTEIEVEALEDTNPPQLGYLMLAEFPGNPICEPVDLLVNDFDNDPVNVTYLTA